MTNDPARTRGGETTSGSSWTIGPYLAFDYCREVHVIVQGPSLESPLTPGRLNRLLCASSAKSLLDAITAIGPLCSAALHRKLPRSFSFSRVPKALSYLSEPHIDDLCEDLGGLLRASKHDYLLQARSFIKLAGWNETTSASVFAAAASGIPITIEPLSDWLIVRAITGNLVRLCAPSLPSGRPAFGTVAIRNLPGLWNARIVSSASRPGDLVNLLTSSYTSKGTEPRWLDQRHVCAITQSFNIPGTQKGKLWFVFGEGQEQRTAEAVIKSLQGACSPEGPLVGWDVDFRDLLESPSNQSVRCGSRIAEAVRLALYHPGLEPARCLSCGRGFLRPSTIGRRASYCSGRCRKAASRGKVGDDDWRLSS